MNRREEKKGFTLVELLIVAIIIGILAAVTLPQFGMDADKSSLYTLNSNLAVIRDAVELYFYQHNNTYPGRVTTHKNGTHAGPADAFVKQLTMYSDLEGNTSDVRDVKKFPFGPYLRSGIPSNPLSADSSKSSAVVVTTDREISQATFGWKFDRRTGAITANTPQPNSR